MCSTSGPQLPGVKNEQEVAQSSKMSTILLTFYSLKCQFCIFMVYYTVHFHNTYIQIIITLSKMSFLCFFAFFWLFARGPSFSEKPIQSLGYEAIREYGRTQHISSLNAPSLFYFDFTYI